MFARVIQIKVHLARIGMRELADFQINNHKAPQFAVKEKKIDAVPFAAESQSALATDEGSGNRAAKSRTANSPDVVWPFLRCDSIDGVERIVWMDSIDGVERIPGAGNAR